MALRETYSVVVPTYNEEATIGDCLRSLLDATDGTDAVEILVVDGESTDATRDIVTNLAAEYDAVSLHTEHEGSTAAALNVGIERSRNDIVVFVGGHSTVSNDFFTALDATFHETAPDADVVGGVMVPEPKSRFERYVSTALRTPLGASSDRFRPVEGYVDTVNFGAYRKHVFDDVGLVDTDLVRAEDYEFNVRVREHVYRIYQNPDVRVYYRPRGTVEGLARQYFGNGFWKPRAHAKHDARFERVADSSPAVRVGLFVALAILATVLAPAILMAGVGYLLVTTAVVARTCREFEEANLRDVPGIVAALTVVHASFGAGFGYGLLTLGWR